MTEDPAGRQTRNIAVWLGEGPTHAPADLLSRSMAAVTVTRQRRSSIAVLLGAPTLASDRGVPVRLWVAAAVLALAAVLTLIAMGSWRPTKLLTAVPSPISTITDETPIPTGAAPTVPPRFDAGENVFVSWSPVNPWTKVTPIPGGNPMLMARHLREVTFESCINGCTGRFVIDFIVGTIDEGLLYGWRSCPDSIRGGLECAIYQAEFPGGVVLKVEGKTTDEITSAWQAEFGPAQQVQSRIVNDDQWQVLTYDGLSVAIVVNGSRIVAVTVRAQGGLPASAVPTMLERFLPAIQFGEDPNPGLLPPVSATLGDLTLTLPRNFAMNVAAGVMSVNEDTGSFLFIDDRITRLTPGGSMRIERYGGSGASSFEVVGATLDELRTSITLGIGDAGPVELRIGDARGYRWNVAQASISHPLVAVAVIEWKGVFYVFEEHFPLDAAAAGNFDLLLEGVTLQ